MYPVGGLALSLKQSGANGATGSLFFCFFTGLQNIKKKSNTGCLNVWHLTNLTRGCRGCDHMVVGFTTTCAIGAYHHQSCEFKSCSWWGVLNKTLSDQVCQWLATGQWFSPGTPI